MATLRARPYADEADAAAMRGLVSALLLADWPALRLHPGDVDWWIALEHGRDRTLDQIVRLWFDDAGLAAYAWLGVPEDVDLLVRADVPFQAVLGDAMTWAETARVAVAPAETPLRPLRVWAREGASEAAACEGAGLVPGDPTYRDFTGSIVDLDLSVPPLPPGFVVRALQDTDVASRTECGRAAFDSTTTVERYRAVRARPSYRPELDVIVVDPTGRVVAFALAWLDLATGVVELEPVGVHPDLHRRGLGRAVCRAAIRRAADRGAARVKISSEIANAAAGGLYASLGLQPTVRFVPYSRP